MADGHKRIITACSKGDRVALATLFQEFNFDLDHPQTVCSLDRIRPENQQLPIVTRMFEAATSNQQIEVVSFLATRFPKSSLYRYPMQAAIETCNAELLKAVCKVDPAAANASKNNGAKLIKVLLDAGADPNNDPPFKIPACRNVSAAVLGDLPTSTFEQFFDAGYQGNDPFAVGFAAEKDRSDILEVLFRRSKSFRRARFPPEEEMIEAANKANNLAMMKAIKSAYATLSKENKGLLASLIGKFRSQE